MYDFSKKVSSKEEHAINILKDYSNKKKLLNQIKTLRSSNQGPFATPETLNENPQLGSKKAGIFSKSQENFRLGSRMLSSNNSMMSKSILKVGRQNTDQSNPISTILSIKPNQASASQLPSGFLFSKQDAPAKFRRPKVNKYTMY